MQASFACLGLFVCGAIRFGLRDASPFEGASGSSVGEQANYRSLDYARDDKCRV